MFGHKSLLPMYPHYPWSLTSNLPEHTYSLQPPYWSDGERALVPNLMAKSHRVCMTRSAQWSKIPALFSQALPQESQAWPSANY